MNRDERTTATLYAARCNASRGRAKDGERDEGAKKLRERVGKWKGGRRGGLVQEGKTYARTRERVEQFHIVLLFNSDRVIDLAAACVRVVHTYIRIRAHICTHEHKEHIHTHASHTNIYTYVHAAMAPAAVAETGAKVFDGWE